MARKKRRELPRPRGEVNGFRSLRARRGLARAASSPHPGAPHLRSASGRPGSAGVTLTDGTRGVAVGSPVGSTVVYFTTRLDS